jgi:hypothetical protein
MVSTRIVFHMAGSSAYSFSEIPTPLHVVAKNANRAEALPDLPVPSLTYRNILFCAQAKPFLTSLTCIYF